MTKIENEIDPVEFTEGLYGEVPEIIRHLWAMLPLGQEIVLSNGRIGRLKAFVQPRERDGRWEFGFDVVFDKGSPDHLEFFLKHTGGGGMVCEAVTPIASTASGVQ